MKQQGRESKAVPLYVTTSGSGPERKIPVDFQKLSWGSQSGRVGRTVHLSLLVREERRTCEVSLYKVQEELRHPYSSCLSILFIFLFIPFPELQNLPFQPVQLKFAGKHNLGNPKGPVGPIQASFTPNPRARF